MPFVYPHLSIVAILVAAAAHFVLGFVWYSGLTPVGKRWASEAGMAGTDPGGGAGMAIFPISSVMAAWAVAMAFGWAQATGPLDGVSVGWVIAFAVAAHSLSQGVATRGSMVLHLINLGYIAVGYGIMGAVIGLLT